MILIDIDADSGEARVIEILNGTLMFCFGDVVSIRIADGRERAFNRAEIHLVAVDLFVVIVFRDTDGVHERAVQHRAGDAFIATHRLFFTGVDEQKRDADSGKDDDER